MSKTGAAFSVRFLRNGDQVITTRNIINRKGVGLALFQVVETTSGTIAPNWDATGLPEGAEKEAVLDAQPIIQVGVRSSYGYLTQIKSVKWSYDNTELKFTLNGETWVTASNNAKFQARIYGAFYQLQIIGNLADANEVANKQITYDVAYVSNGMEDTVQGSVDVLIQAAGSNSHLLQITADRVELDAEHTTANLTAVGMYGTQPVVIGNTGPYTIQWYQDGEELAGQTYHTLHVTRDMVEGGSIFIAKLFLDSTPVAQDSQRINDIADEYQIMATPTAAGANWVGVGHNATYNLSLLRNGKTYAGEVTYAWTVYNAEGKTRPDGKGEGPTVTVTSADAVVGTGESAYYADCDVQVTAEF